MRSFLSILMLSLVFSGVCYAGDGVNPNPQCEAIFAQQEAEASALFGFPVPPINSVIEFSVFTQGTDSIIYSAIFTFEGLDSVWYGSVHPFSLQHKYETGELRIKPNGNTKIIGMVTPVDGPAQWITGELIPYNVNFGGDIQNGYQYYKPLDPSSDKFWAGPYSWSTPENWDCSWIPSGSEELSQGNGPIVEEGASGPQTSLETLKEVAPKSFAKKVRKLMDK